MVDSMTQWVVASGVALAILGTGFAAAAQEGGAKVAAQEGGAPKKDTEAAASKHGEAPDVGPTRARVDELVDCTVPGPSRVRVHLDARKEPFTFRAAERRGFIDDQWKHTGWQGTM